jgi:hypothetical protein
MIMDGEIIKEDKEDTTKEDTTKVVTIITIIPHKEVDMITMEIMVDINMDLKTKE